MDEDEFINCMSQDFPELQISKNDLANPTCQFLKKYYVTLLEAISRISARTMCHFTEDQLEFLQNCGGGPSILQHVSNLNLYLAVKHIFDNINTIQSEFHYSDLLFPALSPKRSFVFMAVMHRFFASCAEFDDAFTGYCTVAEKAKEISTLKDDIEIIKRQLSIKAAEKTKRAERVAEINRKLAEYNEINERSQVVIKQLQEKEDQEILRLKELEEIERTHQEKVTQVDNEKKYYESLVVSDESKVIENHRKIVNTKDECLVKIKDVELKVQEGSYKAGMFDKVLNLQEVLNVALQEQHLLGTQLLGIKELYLTACTLKTETEDLDKMESGLITQLNEKEGLMPSTKTECSKLETQINSIKSIWAEKLNNYDAILKDLHHSLSDMPSEEQFNTEINILRKTIEELNVEYQVNADEVSMIHSTFFEQFETFGNALQRYLENTKMMTDNYIENLKNKE